MTYIAADAQQTQQDAIAVEQAAIAAQYKSTVFDKIALAAGQGLSQITVILKITDYAIIKPVLAYYGYSVGDYTVISDPTRSPVYINFVISWPVSYVVNVPTIVPSYLKMIKGCVYSATFYLSDTTFIAGNHTWTVVNGAWPTGITLTNNTVSGTPVQTGDGFVDITVTDTSGSTISTVSEARVYWNISAVMEDAVSISTQNRRSSPQWPI